MSRFDKAVSVVLDHEGGYVDHPADPGGATNYGISLRFLQRSRIDPNRDGAIDKADIRGLTLQQARDIYRAEFWEPGGYEGIEDEGVARKVFDMAVNMGPKQAHRLFQRAANDLGADLLEDGVIGQRTLSQVNQLDGRALLDVLRVRQGLFYIGLNRPVFLRGWLRRALA